MKTNSKVSKASKKTSTTGKVQIDIPSKCSCHDKQGLTTGIDDVELVDTNRTEVMPGFFNYEANVRAKIVLSPGCTPMQINGRILVGADQKGSSGMHLESGSTEWYKTDYKIYWFSSSSSQSVTASVTFDWMCSDSETASTGGTIP